MQEAEMVLTILTLIDMVLVASLVDGDVLRLRELRLTHRYRR